MRKQGWLGGDVSTQEPLGNKPEQKWLISGGAAPACRALRRQIQQGRATLPKDKRGQSRDRTALPKKRGQNPRAEDPHSSEFKKNSKEARDQRKGPRQRSRSLRDTRAPQKSIPPLRRGESAKEGQPAPLLK